MNNLHFHLFDLAHNKYIKIEEFNESIITSLLLFKWLEKNSRCAESSVGLTFINNQAGYGFVLKAAIATFYHRTDKNILILRKLGKYFPLFLMIFSRFLQYAFCLVFLNVKVVA